MRAGTPVLIVALTAQVAVSAVQQGLPAIGPVLQTTLQVSLPTAGLLLGAVGAAGALTMWAWGAQADRVGDRRVLLLGLPAAAAALAVAAWAAQARWVLAVLVTLVAAGAGVAAGTAALSMAVAQRVPPARWGRVLGARQAAVPAGGLLAAVLLPLVAAGGGVGAAFAALATLLVVAVVAVGLGLSAGPVPPTRLSLAASRPTGGTRVPGLGLLLAGNGCYCVAQTGTVAWAVTAWHTTAGCSTAMAAGLFAAVQAATIAVRVAVGRLTDASPGGQPRLLVAIGAGTATVLGALAAAHAAGAPTVVVAVLLATAAVAAGAWNGTAFTVSTRLAAAAGAATRLGRIHGLQNTVLFTAVGLTPPALAVVVTHAGWATAWALLAVIAAVGVAVHAPLRVPSPQGPPQAPTSTPIPSNRSAACASAVPITSC